MVATMMAWYEPGQTEPLPLGSPAEVDGLVDRMLVEASESDVGLLAQVERQDDDGWAVLQVGVRSSVRGFVGYMGPDGSVLSAGGATSPEPVAYDYMNHEREVSSAAEISLAVVRLALQDFVASGGARPGGVTWQEA